MEEEWKSVNKQTNKQKIRKYWVRELKILHAPYKCRDSENLCFCRKTTKRSRYENLSYKWIPVESTNSMLFKCVCVCVFVCFVSFTISWNFVEKEEIEEDEKKKSIVEYLT